jgi:hypothetical protein
MSYRSEVRAALNRAKNELNAGDADRVRYAVLELRMSLEGLIYERAETYKEELPQESLRVWQPRQLLAALLELDPNADKGAAVAVGIEEIAGEPSKSMRSLGRERVLSLRELKTYYDRLGSYLHMPRIGDVAAGKGATEQKARVWCEEVADIVEIVLASPIFNVNFKVTSRIKCDKCGEQVARRIPLSSATELHAKCLHCEASYTLIVDASRNAIWKPRISRIECVNQKCKAVSTLWEHELKLGAKWKCAGCGQVNRLVYGIEAVSATES